MTSARREASAGAGRAREAGAVTGRRCRRRLLAVIAAAVGVLAGACVAGTAGQAGRASGSEPPGGASGCLEHPIDPRQQTLLDFGERSHWLQPWRGYLDTPPAARLLRAIGVNFLDIGDGEAGATARLLRASGVRRARIEIPWSSVSYADPSRLANVRHWRTLLTALRDNGIRPLILLNGHSGDPGPSHKVTLSITQPASAGARQVQLTPSSAASVVPRHTGFDSEDGTAAETLITAVAEDGTSTLSKPLSADLPAGDHAARTLLYEPFQRPVRADGSENPVFGETLQGWLRYVQDVTDLARSVVGSTGFDLEVWNELSFGSAFLDSDNYYDPPVDSGPGDTDTTADAVLRRTIRYVRDVSHGASDAPIGNGFANQRPWDSGATSPAGLSAIDRHPYPHPARFPAGQPVTGVQPVNALGQPEGTQDGSGGWHDAFVPRYTALFPEYFLSGIQTETMVRDLSPITTEVYGDPHGRRTHPPDGAPPAVWITELNQGWSGWVPRTAARRFQAKVALRALVSYANKGATQIDLFAVKRDDDLALVDPRFFTRLDRGVGAYPGDDAGGITMIALRRMVHAFAGAAADPPLRRLTLSRVCDSTGRVQFTGDGTPAHPPLTNRDVLAFFPFQVSRSRFVAAVYVMSRDLSRVYRADLPISDPARYDLPPEAYRLTVGGLSTCDVGVAATDPLTGGEVRATVRSCRRGRAVIQLPVTDSPRMLTILEKRGQR